MKTELFSIATVCVQGNVAQYEQDNELRIQMLQTVEKGIKDKNKRDLAAILFPGGFFCLPSHIGHNNHTERVRILSQQEFSKACCATAQNLNTTVVAGVDGTQCKQNHTDAPDQLCVAWGCKKIVGLGRKVFPAKEEADSLVIYANDMTCENRLAPLRKRNFHALLCSCYDIYGCTETANNQRQRSKNIIWLNNGDNNLLNRRDRNNRQQVNEAISDRLRGWEKLVKKATVGLVAIHHFTNRGNGSGKGYWQRFGIESPSGVLGGKLAFGAAHFETLPEPNVCLFAAKNKKLLRPSECFHLNNGCMLVRVFQV